MKSNYFSTKNILTAIFILSIIYTTLQLFSLQDDLILSSASLNSSDIAAISPVLRGLYISVTIMVLSGLITLIVIFRTEKNTSDNIVNVDRSESSKATEKEEKDQTEEKATLDLSFIKNKISSLKDEEKKLQTTLTELCKKLEIGQGAIYLAKKSKGKRYLEFQTGYAFSIAESETVTFEFGEGLVGQAAKEGQTLTIDEIPDNYINIVSGLGSSSPNHLLIVPLTKNGETYAVVEMASFVPFDKENINLISESFALLNEAKSTPKPKAEKAEKTEKKETKVKKEALAKKTTKKDKGEK